MEKLKMESQNICEKNLLELEKMFPSCITEIKNPEGKIVKAVNFDMLKQLLSPVVIDGEEHYEFTWSGKKEAIVQANKPIRKTLRPCLEKSSLWDNTENIYIEGDNLEALKLLQESYLGAIQLIYIDPPYNTGHDFVYRDNFSQSLKEYQEESGEFDEAGNRLFVNTDSNGRFHSDWCSMMYSRLMLARNLLSDDGLIFISIGDEEVDNLRKIADEIFGDENFRNQIVVRRGAKSLQAQFDTWDKLGQGLEYILFYSKNSDYRFPKQMKPLEDKKQGGWNNHWRGTDRPTMRYELYGYTPDKGQWRWSRERSLKAIENYERMLRETGMSEENVAQERIDSWYEKQKDSPDLLRKSANGKPEHYIAPSSNTLLNNSWIDLLIGSSSEIGQLFESKVFDTAKLTTVIRRIIKFAPKDATILDFFSGSATTAHAVMQMNAEDGGKRKYIMIQIPEEVQKKTEAFEAGYKNICEIGEERIRKSAAKIKEDTSADIDYGFRVFTVDDSNMKDVYYTANEYTQNLLPLLESNIKEERTGMDLLFSCVLEWGLPLSLPYTTEQLEGFTVHDYNNGALIACFEENIPETVIRAIAGKKPARAVFRDSSFADSPSKINVGEIFKLLSPDTSVKVI